MPRRGRVSMPESEAGTQLGPKRSDPYCLEYVSRITDEARRSHHLSGLRKQFYASVMERLNADPIDRTRFHPFGAGRYFSPSGLVYRRFVLAIRARFSPADSKISGALMK